MNDHDLEIQDVIERLSILAPGTEEAPGPSATVLLQLKHRVASAPVGRGSAIQRSKNIMSNRRLTTAGLALVLVVAIFMAFPSVRAAASDFLGLFRVQKFAPISVSPEQLAMLEQLEEQGTAPGEFVVVKESGEPQAVDSVEAAEAMTGFDLYQLPDRDFGTEVYVMDDASGYLVVDLAGARAIMSAAGADPQLLPDSLDGARIDVTVFDSVQQIHPDGLTLMQTPSPMVVYPENVDATRLGEALLQVLGTDPVAAGRIAQSIDWTSTLLLPIPQDLASYQDVNIGGNGGVLLEPFDPAADPAVMWQQDGMVLMMTGPFDAGELLRLANTLR